MDFFELIRNGELENIKQLVTADPGLLEARDARGFPPLVLASYHEQYDTTKYLLEAGADVNVQDAAGNTALMGICFKGYPTIAALLLEHGADVNKQNANGATALIYTATFGQNEIARMLLDHGADKTLQDQRGNTATDHAKMQGAPGMEELLTN
ncbi:MAG: ankyrin repeat domain-containing protein [Cyclobacteriaceae bacterium]